MANRKISQFTTTTDITTVQGLAGYNATTNVQISGSALITSLEANLYKPFGQNGEVLTIVNGVPAWAPGGSGGAGTMQDVYNNSNAATANVIGATLTTADLDLKNKDVFIQASGPMEFQTASAPATPHDISLVSSQNVRLISSNVPGVPGNIQLAANEGEVQIASAQKVIIEGENEITLTTNKSVAANNIVINNAGAVEFNGGFGAAGEALKSRGAGLTPVWGKISLNNSAGEVSGVLGVQNGGTGVGSLTDGRLVVGGGTGTLSTIASQGKGTLVVGRTVGLLDSTGAISVGTDGQVLTADSTVAEYGVKWADPSTGTTYTYTATGTNDPNLTLSDGTTPQNIKLQGSGNTTVSNNANVITISSTGGSGGAEAFTTITTDPTTEEAVWDFTADGPNIQLTPVAAKLNNIVMANGVYPDNGTHGYLVLDPTNTTGFQLPPNSLILNGDVFPNGTNPTTYEYVYDGTNFYWEKQSNLVAPIYPPVNPFPTQNLIGVWDPETINPAFLLAGNPYDDAIVPDDPSNTNDIQVNYGIGNGATWTNSYTVNNIIGDMTATSNPASSSSSYKPSFVKNDVGPLKEQTYDSTTTPPVLVPNPTSLASVSNTQAFYFQDVQVTGAGDYTTIGADIEVQNGSIDVSRGAEFKITSDGTDITEIEVLDGGDGYSIGDLIQVDLNSSSIASGELYILVQGPMLDGIAAIQFGYPQQAEFGSETFNQSYGFSSTSFNTAQNNIKTVMMWVYGAFPDQSTYNCLFDCRDTGGSTDAEAMYINGTTGATFLYSPNYTFSNIPLWKDYSAGGGYNANNQWHFLCFIYFPNNTSGFVTAIIANQDTLDNKAPTSPGGTNINNWAYQGTLGTATVGVDEDGFCSDTSGFLTLDESPWDDFHIGNSASENEGLRAKIGKFALYNAIVPAASIVQAFNASKGYYGLT